MTYKYSRWAAGHNGNIFSENVLRGHDQRIGAFIRAFASAEFLMKQTICHLYGVENPLGGFLMSKMSAGQTADLYKDAIKNKTQNKIQKIGVDAAKKFLSLNSFRNEIAHGTHMFDGDTPVLVKFKAESVGSKAIDVDLSEKVLDGKIYEVYDVIDLLVAVYGKSVGYQDDIDNIVAMAKRGDIGNPSN